MSEERTAEPNAVTAPGITPHSSLRTAIAAFQPHMEQRNLSPHTFKAFNYDLQLLEQFMGAGIAVGQVSTRDLNAFLKWLTDERGVKCSPKSLARRVTTIKVFFGWLAEAGAIPEDPAEPVIHRPVMAPLPRILSDSEAERVLGVTELLRRGEKPDARPHLLVTLILFTGIKKGECMGIILNHIDLSDPDQPFLWVRYANPRRRHKERKLLLPSMWPATLAEYRAQYQPESALFPCTARNLEYVLTDVAGRAELPHGLSFEMLRWTCAVGDYRAGMQADRLRQKLGLSKVSWRETGVKIAKLAGKPL